MNTDNHFVENEAPANEEQNDLSASDAGDKSASLLGRVAGLVKFGVNFITRNGQLAHKTHIPPVSDVAELEYISALHQCESMDALRQDGSISSVEIANYLKSRHGLKVTPETVRTVVLQDGLTADKDENDPTEEGGGGVLDLVELTSVLIIPNLFRLRQKKLDEDMISSANVKSKKLLQSTKIQQRQPSLGPSHFGADADEKFADNVDILRDVLSLILEDCTGDSSPKCLDAELVRDILRGYGEGALARDDELVKEMVEVAKRGNSSESSTTANLDFDAFVEALTSDVARNYGSGRDERFSTNFQDVWVYARDSAATTTNRSSDRWDEEGGTSRTAVLLEQTFLDKVKESSKCCQKEEDLESSEVQIDKDGRVMIKRLFTGQSIDYTVDNYRTRLFVLLLWIAFVAFWAAYLRVTANYSRERCDTTTSLQATVACPLVSGIVNQLLLITKLIFLGVPIILLGSVGNSIEGKESMRWIVTAIVCFAAFFFVPFFVEFEIPLWFSSRGGNKSLKVIATVFGSIVILMQVLHVGMLFIRKTCPGRRWISKYFTWGNIRYEAMVKRGGLFKIDRMLTNAHEVHRTVMKSKSAPVNASGAGLSSSQFLSNFGRALNEYFKIQGKMTTIGGVVWTWKRIFDGRLFTEEGIWIGSRVFLGSVLQVVAIVASPFVIRFGAPRLESFINEEPGMQVSTSTYVATAIGVTFAFLAAILIFSLFIPTMVATTLKFRRGVLQSLRSEDFLHRYRFALDQAALVFPGMFWGILFSSIAIAVVTGGFVYLLLWEQTSQALLGLIGNLLGLLIIMIFKIILSQIFRFSFFAAFYRKRPFSGNIFTTVIEVYSIAISLYFMVTRMVKIIIISALYLGRIDTPLFASGVGIFGPLEVDNWPTVSRKDILIHEAHRHPYLEQLGYLYMMQLRFGNGGFARRACSAWRLVFVLALMPWMHKYRDMTRPDHFGEDEAEENTDDEGNDMMFALATGGSTDSSELQGKKSPSL